MKVPPEITKVLEQNQSFLMHIHTGPDPDCIGSTLAFKLALEQLGKVVTIFGEDEVISAAYFLPDSDQIVHTNLTEAIATYPHDIYLSVDTAAPSMITNLKPFPVLHAPIVNIDHHPDNIISAKYNFVAPQACSAAEVVYQVLLTLKDVKITPDIATCLLFGILGDTSAFQNSNTTDTTLKLAAELIAAGGDYQSCMVALTRSFSPDEMKVYGYLLHHLELSDDGSYVIYKLNNDQYMELGGRASIGVFSNFFANKVAGTKFSLVIIEKKPGFVIGSMRSRDYSFDVSLIAHQLGGGGHKVAAAFRSEKSLESTLKDFHAAVVYLQSKSKI
jgi:bifunctional oligoribonuclease and PAP phosphatase NrnA